MKCGRCHRSLRSAASIAAGMGWRCQRLDRADRKREALESALRIAAAPYSGKQVDDANALIAAGKQERASRPGLWATESSDGTTVYTTTALNCTCRANGPCKHMCAVAQREIYETFQEVA